jgi:hypothetical protein
VNNYPITIVRAYSGDLAGTPVPAQTIAGIHVFSILSFSGSKKHLFGMILQNETFFIYQSIVKMII